MALQFGKPKIFNTDPGAQLTSSAFTGVLKDNGIDISMDDRGRCMDNIFTERLWRSLKYENVYLMHYVSVPEGRQGIDSYFNFYNDDRPHQALKDQTPAEVYFQRTRLILFMAFDGVIHSQVPHALLAPPKGRGQAGLGYG